MRKVLVILLSFLFIATANALMVTDVNVSKMDGGGGFLTTDTNINFTVWDDNTEVMAGIDYVVDIYYSTAKGGTDNLIVNDLNLGDVNATSGYCLTPPATFGSATNTRCSYVWTASSINAISDGNYYIDVNLQTKIHTGGTSISSQNMDTNNSFYVDNTSPVCSIDKKRGNQFQWQIDKETEAQSVGSQTTVYYRKNERDSYQTLTFDGSTTYSDDHFKIQTGRQKYSCYGVDTAGNVGSTTTREIEYPGDSGQVIIGPPVTVPTTPGTSGIHPVVILILLVLGAGFLYVLLKRR